jgi:hypothetical protein
VIGRAEPVPHDHGWRGAGRTGAGEMARQISLRGRRVVRLGSR